MDSPLKNRIMSKRKKLKNRDISRIEEESIFSSKQSDDQPYKQS